RDSSASIRYDRAVRSGQYFQIVANQFILPAASKSRASESPRASRGNQKMKPSSKFDIVVYGATGFTGQLVAEYLAAHYAGKSDLKWAMAGRSLDKLASVRDAVGAPADTALIVADAGDPHRCNPLSIRTGRCSR